MANSDRFVRTVLPSGPGIRDNATGVTYAANVFLDQDCVIDLLNKAWEQRKAGSIHGEEYRRLSFGIDDAVRELRAEGQPKARYRIETGMVIHQIVDTRTNETLALDEMCDRLNAAEREARK